MKMFKGKRMMKKKVFFVIYILFIMAMLVGCGLIKNNSLSKIEIALETQENVEDYTYLFEKDIEFKTNCEVIYSEENIDTYISIMAAVANDAVRMSYKLDGNGFDIYSTSKKIYMNTSNNYENNWVFAKIYEKKYAEDLLEIYKNPIILKAEDISFLGHIREEIEQNVIYDVVELAYRDIDEEGKKENYRGYCYINRDTKEIQEIKLISLEKNAEACIRRITSIEMPSEAIGAEEVNYDTLCAYMLDIIPDDFVGLKKSQDNKSNKENKLAPYKEYFYGNNVFPKTKHIYVDGESYKVPYKLEFADDENKHMEKYYLGNTFIEFYVIGDLTYLHVNKERKEDRWYFMHDTNGESTKDIRKYLFETLVFSNSYIEVISYNEQLSSEDYDVLNLDLNIGESDSTSLVWINKEKGHLEKISTDYGYEEQKIVIDEKVSIELPKKAELAEELKVEKMIERYKESITNGVYDLLSNARYIE
ncbi:MAG: hypothetical protein IKK33_12625 [Lachnospiraceae bacterium]|nr:hypothetical protein [Lachnospiraceae bacterium]